MAAAHADVWGRHWGASYITSNGEMWGWGFDRYGQLGLGGTSEDRSLTRLAHYEDARKIDSGLYHTIMLKNDGTVWANGHNAYGQLGLGDNHERHRPAHIKKGLNESVLDIIAAHHSTSTLTTTGRYA